MHLTIVQSRWCNYRVISLPADHILDIWPEPGFSHGREMARLGGVWSRLSGQALPGLLLLGCDVAADPLDLAAMTIAVSGLPEDVHTGLVKLWPFSTKRGDWMWSHRAGVLGQPVAGQQETMPAVYFSLGFLWAPARLLDLMFPDASAWRWGEADVKLSELALRHAIPAHVVRGARPKHLHFQPEHDGEAIRRRYDQQHAPE